MLICPFCFENGFDELGLEIHLANYCMIDQHPKLNSVAYCCTVELFWTWYLPYNNQNIYKDDIAKMAYLAGYRAAQQSVERTGEESG